MIQILNNLLHSLVPNWIYERLIGRWNNEGLKRYTANTLWALLVRIVSILTSFFVTIYLVRYLGPENYGQLSYAISFVGLFSIIASLGIDNILYRDLIKYPEQINTYLGSAFILKLSAGVIAATFVIIVSFFFSHDDVSRLVIFMLAGTFIFNASNVIGYEFQAKVAQKYVSFVSLFVIIILNLLKIIVILMGEGIIYIGLILLLEAILYALLFIYIRIRHYGSIFAWRFDQRIAISLLKDSWPFIFIAAFTTIYVRIDQVMLKNLLDSSAVGFYDAAVRIAEAWLFFPAIIASSLFPAIVNARQAGVREYKKRLIALATILCTFATLVAIPASLLAGPLMVFFYGAAFASSASVFAIYVWAGVWASLDIVVRYFLVAENKRFLIFFSTFSTALINIILNMILIPKFGIAGAAWATLISYAFLAIPFVIIINLKTNNPDSGVI